MRWFLPALEVGDWVKVTERVPVSWTDHLTESGVRPGTIGVVTGRIGASRVEVEFDGGFGTCRATVRERQLRLHRPGAGVAAFRRRSSLWTAIRAGAALALIAPVVWFVVQYLWYERTTDGLLVGFASGAIESAADLVTMAISDPIATSVYLIAGWAVQRLAFGPVRRR